MRKTAHFPARDLRSFKKKVIHWAGNFSVCACFDFNSYKTFHPDGDFLAGIGAEEIIPSEAAVFPSLKSFYERNRDWLFGFFSYDLKKEVEPKVFSASDERFDGIQFPLASFFRPQHIVEITHDEVIVHSTADPEKIFRDISNTRAPEFIPPRKKIHARTTREEYLSCVNKIKEHIANGDLYEMNLCQEFFAEEISVNAASLFCRLNDISAAPFACFIKNDDHYLLCASPERFLKKEGNKIISQPMKGTIARGNNENDAFLREHLRHDSKERAENVMIVDLVRNDLSRSAIPGSVKVDELFGVYTFPNVHQMISTVSATLRNDVHFIDAIKNAFPMGSMTGAPKVMAMQLIDQFETVKRGLFSGAAGFITPDGDFDFNVVIRSILYNASTGYLSFQAGSAITYDCIPEKEYEECLLKAQNMMRAIGETQSAG